MGIDGLLLWVALESDAMASHCSLFVSCHLAHQIRLNPRLTSRQTSFR
jgi:hypothetical protein